MVVRGMTRGMTLIEMVLVVTIIGLMMAISGPKFASMRRQLRLDFGAQQLAGDLHRARLEAIKRNTPVFLAKTGASSYEIRFVRTYTLPQGVAFGAGDPDTVWFAAFGPVLTGSAMYELVQGSNTKRVELNAAGFAAVK